MSEPVSGSNFGDWEAVMAEALAASGGPLTADERAWAASTFNLSFDPAGSHAPLDTTVPLPPA